MWHRRCFPMTSRHRACPGMTIEPEPPRPSPHPRFGLVLQKKGFFFFLREWHTVDSQMNQPNVTQLLQSWRCSRRYEEVRSRFLETDRVIFNYFILRTHWFNPAVILFPFNSSQPARHSWLQSGFFSWKDYRCVQLTTMHFGGNEHVEDNPKKSVSRWILWVKSSQLPKNELPDPSPRTARHPDKQQTNNTDIIIIIDYKIYTWGTWIQEDDKAAQHGEQHKHQNGWRSWFERTDISRESWSSRVRRSSMWRAKNDYYILDNLLDFLICFLILNVRKKVEQCFPKPEITSSNVFFCPQLKDTQFTVI